MIAAGRRSDDAELAHVDGGDADELVAAGLEAHAFEQDAIALLELGALGDRRTRAAQAPGQIVAEALQLAQAQQPRAGAAGHRPFRVGARIGGEEGGGQLALELGDLLAQGASRRALVRLDDRREPRAQRGRMLLGRCDVVFQKLHQKPSSDPPSLPTDPRPHHPVPRRRP